MPQHGKGHGYNLSVFGLIVPAHFFKLCFSSLIFTCRLTLKVPVAPSFVWHTKQLPPTYFNRIVLASISAFSSPGTSNLLVRVRETSVFASISLLGSLTLPEPSPVKQREFIDYITPYKDLVIFPHIINHRKTRLFSILSKGHFKTQTNF